MSLSQDGAYGWHAVPRDTSVLVSSADTKKIVAVDADAIVLPSDALSRQVLDYAKAHLPSQTLNHSLRVFLYGHIIATQQFPDLLALPSFTETYFATCMLHDIGTTDSNLKGMKDAPITDL